MASKRRRSRSAAGCGPFFGFFLTLAAIGLLIQYWWVLVIGLSMVALIVALVKTARTPSPRATPQPPAPVRASEPKPLVRDDLAAEMRATKRVRHVRAMQEWDYEWIRLTYPEKSSRELNEIANAHFARGRSVGVNYGGPSVPRLNGREPDKHLR